MKKSLLFLLLCLLSLGAQSKTPLSNDTVFQVSTKRTDPNTFIIHWQIKPEHFLYAKRIKIKKEEQDDLQINIMQMPKAERKTDKQGKTFSVYRNTLTLPVAVLASEPGESLIQLHYQGCADDGFCYPPVERTIKLTFNKELELVATSLEKPVPKTKVNDQLKAKISKEEAVFDDHWTIIILSFFGFGLLLAFTPCVLPMVPVLSGIIVGHGSDLTTRKAFLLSLSYVLSMAATYALVGALVAYLGSNLQILMQSPWSISLFSFIFVLLSLSMFGFYELKLPTSWQSKLASISRSKGSGHYLSAAIMGCLSTLILSPCVTAPLIGALSYIAHTGDLMLGSLALFFLGLGMGLPLLLIGTSAGKLLPKAGDWMNSVKSFFGFLLLAVAVYLMDRIIPSFISMILWGSLFIFSGISCGALNTQSKKISQSTGLILLVYGLLILIGASMGNNNPIQPLKPLLEKDVVYAKTSPTSKKRVMNLAETKQAIQNAQGKPVMLDFYADWCNSCKVMEATTFKDPEVANALKDFVILKADITANNREDQNLLRHYSVVAPPTFLFFDSEGNEIESLRIIGEADPQTFIKNIQAYREMMKNQ